MIDPAVASLGYTEADLNRVVEMAAGGGLSSPEDVRRIIDNFQYLDDWRANYRIQSVRSSLHNTRITCIDAAILSYGLLELLCGHVQRRLLAIHRRDPKSGEEVGHCVALYWSSNGRIGAISKSSFKGLGHREPIFPDETAVASSLAKAYVDMGFQPLYFGVTTLEEAAPDIDWRFHQGDLNILSERLQASYQYGFEVGY
ncbi:MAG TPA: hypothetical protein VGF83_06495 [Actinomycetota bacterium]